MPRLIRPLLALIVVIVLVIALSWGTDELAKCLNLDFNLINGLIAIATLLVAYVAVTGDPFRTWVFPPRLRVSIRKEAPDSHKMPLIDQNTYAYYFRLRIENRGASAAKNVEVFAHSLKKWQNGEFKRMESFLPMHFCWSHFRFVSYPRIGPKAQRHCDVGEIVKPKDDLKFTFKILQLVCPSDESNYLCDPGRYELTVVVEAENVKPTKHSFEINFTGDWFDSPDEMLSKKGITITKTK